MNKDFLMQVLAGKKKPLKINVIEPIHEPSYDKLSVKAMYPSDNEDPELQPYF